MNRNEKAISFPSVAYAALVSVCAVVACVALPQVFHLLGLWTGVGSALGEMLLPMHLPVMVAALLAGPVAGVSVGCLSPLISFSLTAMPGAALLPFMMVELAVYGLCAGLLRNHKMPTVCKVLIAQVVGRAVRALVLVASVQMELTRLPISLIWTSISAGVVGIILQLLLIPAVMRLVRR